MSDTESPFDLDYFFWCLSELETDGQVLTQALRELERVRSSIWVRDDLPHAIDELLEAVKAFQWDAQQIAAFIEKAARKSKDS
jgi:hypothetical protein